MNTLSERFVTLEGQYVLKDLILVAAGMAIAAGTLRGGRLIRDEPGAADPPPAQPVKLADEPDASPKLQIVRSAGRRHPRSSQTVRLATAATSSAA